MPSAYIRRHQCLREYPKNTGVYHTKHMGVRVYSTNRTYVPKKSRGGILVGTNLSWDDCLEIQHLARRGCKKKSLSQRYGVSRYYLNKVLSM